MTSREDILEAYRSGNLTQLIFQGKDHSPDLEHLLVDLHNSKEISLFSLTVESGFGALGLHDFFFGQHTLCNAIPQLEGLADQVIPLVIALVAKGGHDLAANSPNAAFGKWCERNLGEADRTVELALSGHEEALGCLTFALTALGDFERTIEIVRRRTGKARLSAIVCLARMTSLSTSEAVSAVDAILEAVGAENDEMLLGNALLASLDIAKRAELTAHPLVAAIVQRASSSPGPQTPALCARALAFCTASLNKDNARALLEPLSSAPPELAPSLDLALNNLLDSDLADVALDFVLSRLGRDDGAIDISTLDAFKHKLLAGDRKRLQRVVISWLASGQRRLGDALSHLLNDHQEGSSLLEGTSLANFGFAEPMKVFVARKAVGFLFLAPVNAAAVLVAILHDCDVETAREVGTLLFDPLLVNYGGSVREYLEKVPKSDSAYRQVRAALAAAKKYVENLTSVGTIKELHPSETHRQVERQRRREQSRQIHKMTEEQSIFMNLVHRSTLLYGLRSVSYVGPPGAARRPMEMSLQTHSVSFEMPRNEVVDPFGLDYMLRVLRAEAPPK